MNKELEILSESGYLIPIRSIPAALVEKAQKDHLIRIYQEKKCAKCPYLEDRHSENCDNCEGFVGARQTAKKVDYKEGTYFSIPRGRREYLERLLEKMPYDSFRIRSTHRVRPMSRPIRILEETPLRGWQEEAVEVAYVKRRGIIKAPPRAGKTVFGAGLVCKIGQKTLILAHQREWLVQFRETFVGSRTQNKFTDAEEHQVGFARTLADFKKYDICLCTFSQFFSEKGKMVLAKIRSLFPLVMIDECHGVPALATSRVMSQLSPKWCIGLSGTPARKLEVEIHVAHHLIGPIIYEAKVERLRPRIATLPIPGDFQINNKMGRAALTNLQSRLEGSKVRKDKIIDYAIKSSKRGHLVMIPLTRVRSILEWTREINERMEQAGYAVPFFGGMPKEMRVKMMDRLRRFRSKIVVGNISMLSVGLNIPRASHLIESGVTSNIPKAEQRFSRVLTPFEGKPEPLITFTLDNCDFMRKCRRNEFYNVLLPRFNPIIPPDTSKEIASWFSNEGGDDAEFWKNV